MYIEKEEKQEISLDDFEYMERYAIAKAIGDIKTKADGTTPFLLMEIIHIPPDEGFLQKGMTIIYDRSSGVWSRIDEGIYVILPEWIVAVRKFV